LIFEANLADSFDVVVLVDAPLALRARRIRESGRLSAAEEVRRSGTQLTSLEKRKRADICLSNRGKRADLARSVKYLDYLLKNLQN
jgi:dephospho-CoA kinase